MIEAQGTLSFILLLALLAITIALAVREVRRSDRRSPAAHTDERVRPPRAEPIDLSEAIRPRGGLPPWEETRR